MKKTAIAALCLFAGYGVYAQTASVSGIAISTPAARASILAVPANVMSTLSFAYTQGSHSIRISSGNGFAVDGDIILSSSTAGAYGIVLHASDDAAQCFRITVNSSGVVSSTSTVCP